MELHKCGVRTGDVFEAIRIDSNRSYRFISPDKTECVVWVSGCEEITEIDYHLKLINKELQSASLNRDKKSIFEIYEKVKSLDLESVSENVFYNYEILVDRANEVLYS